MKLTFTIAFIFFISFSTTINAQSTSKQEKKVIKPSTIDRQSPRITSSTRPILKSSNAQSKSVNGGIVVGEGKYLTFTKKIMEKSVTGQIPDGFPKHIKGQSEDQYIQIMKTWSKNNLDKIKEKYRAEAAQ